MTASEAHREIKAITERRRRDLQEQASMQYIQAQVIVAFMSRALNGGKGNVPTLEDAYSDLYGNTAAPDRATQTKEEQHNAVLEARVLAWANRVNRKFSKAGG